MPRPVRYEVDAQTEWDARNARMEAVPVDDVLFAPVFRRFLPPGPLDCIEIGAVPGTYLVWLHRELGYRITGIDFTSSSSVFHETMAVNGITEYDFINGDFLTWETKKSYDVVVSLGFIEHFDDVEPVVQKHCDLVRPGGLLVLEVPNFRWAQYMYHRLFDRDELAIHNTGIMKHGALRRCVEQHGFETIHSGYHLRMMLWRAHTPLSKPRRFLERLTRSFAYRIGRRLPDSRFTSGVAVHVFRRPSDDQAPGRRAR